MESTDYSLVEGLLCLVCDRRYPFQLMLNGCPDCMSQGRIGILDPFYRSEASHGSTLSAAKPDSLWDYHFLLPVPNVAATTSLGEGATPLVPLQFNDREVWVKYEAVNPTHSYKDRTNAVAVSTARYFGCDKVLCTSTGNHAVSLAAYAARAGLRCLILMPMNAPPLSLKEMRFFGAEVVMMQDENIIPVMHQLSSEYGWYISQRNAPGVGTRPFGNPYGMEGYKTIAYEIFHQLGGRVPDKVFLPVGGGDAAWGINKGFHELTVAGLTSSKPQIIACQSESGAPLVYAWEQALPQVSRVETAPTIAFSIVEAQTGDHALWAIRDSGGKAIAVDDKSLREAEDLFAAEGFCVEPASAASLAGARKLWDQEDVSSDECNVLIGTGAGIRWPGTFDDQGQTPPYVDGTLGELEHLVKL